MTIFARISVTVLAAGSLGLLAGCISPTMKVKSDHNPATNFSAYKTYGWMPSSGDAQTQTIVHNEIERALTMKGMFYKDTSPDIRISHVITSERKAVVERVDDAYDRSEEWNYDAVTWRTGTTGSEAYLKEITEGSLVIDIFDSKSKKLVWRGSANAEIDAPLSDSQRKSKIEEAVRRTLKMFPPQTS